MSEREHHEPGSPPGQYPYSHEASETESQYEEEYDDQYETASSEPSHQRNTSAASREPLARPQSLSPKQESQHSPPIQQSESYSKNPTAHVTPPSKPNRANTISPSAVARMSGPSNPHVKRSQTLNSSTPVVNPKSAMRVADHQMMTALSNVGSMFSSSSKQAQLEV